MLPYSLVEENSSKEKGSCPDEVRRISGASPGLAFPRTGLVSQRHIRRESEFVYDCLYLDQQFPTGGQVAPLGATDIKWDFGAPWEIEGGHNTMYKFRI